MRRGPWPASGRGEVALGVLLVLATAFVLRAGRGYRSFPSHDDLAYVPLAWRALDPTLYARDLVVAGVPSHLGVWPWVMRGLESSVGLARGYWLLTLLCSVGSALALHRLARAAGGSGRLTPLAAALAFEGAIVGTGRGAFDGAFGDAFHAQWAALLLVLFAQDGLLRRRPAVAGALLGLAIVAHPVVGVHGMCVLGLVALLDRPRAPAAARAGGGDAADRAPRRRRVGAAARPLALLWGVALATSAPILLPLVEGALAGAPPPSWPAARIIDEGWIPRVAAQWTLVPRGWPGVATALFGVAALGAGLRLRVRGARLLVAFTLGELVLLAAGSVAYGPLRHATGLAYQLDLGRTSPLILVQLALLLVVALERALAPGGGLAPGGELAPGDGLAPGGGLAPARSPRALALALAALLAAAAWVRWSGASGLLVALAALALAGAPPDARRLRGAALAGAAGALVVAAAQVASSDVVEAPELERERGLHAWVRDATARDALFVVPPGSGAFRVRTLRAVYVDWKFFPSGAPWLVPEWRRRLEQVAPPDARALAARGTPARREWDLCYEAAMTPARPAELLEATQADYLVRATPTAPEAEDPRAPVVFADAWFTVHARPRAPR